MKHFSSLTLFEITWIRFNVKYINLNGLCLVSSLKFKDLKTFTINSIIIEYMLLSIYQPLTSIGQCQLLRLYHIIWYIYSCVAKLISKKMFCHFGMGIENAHREIFHFFKRKRFYNSFLFFRLNLEIQMKNEEIVLIDIWQDILALFAFL